MERILNKYSKNIDAKSLVKTIEELKVEYVDDGLTKEDIPPILTTLVMTVSKFKRLSGAKKKALVIDVLYHFIEEIDSGEKDSEFEIVLKAMVPPMVDSLAAMLRVKKVCLPCIA